VVESLVVAQKWHDTLTPNVPLEYAVPSADGYDGGVLPLDRWLSLSRLLVPDPRPDGVLLSRLERLPDDRLLDLLGVRYLVANQGAPGRAGLDTVDFGDLRLFVRPASVPRALLVFNATAVADDTAALARLADPSFDPNRDVVLVGSAAPSTSALEPPGQPIEPEDQTPERWRARVSLPVAGYLVQRESWYPGWRARVDGRDEPVQRADVLFRAVALGPGEHEVEVYFQSDTFIRGAFISGVALLVVVGLLLAPPIMRHVGAQGSTHHPAVDQSRPGAAAAAARGD
jgi:hypothetical protein